MARDKSPWPCKLLGHAWHNEQGWDTVIVYNEPCERRSCPVTRNPRPIGVVHYTIDVDVRPLQRAMKRMSEQLQVFAQRVSKVMASPAGRRILQAARHQRDIEEIQAIAAIERRAALGHLDRHMDDLYAELGLERIRPDEPTPEKENHHG